MTYFVRQVIVACKDAGYARTESLFRYVAGGALPRGSSTDASHITIASVHALDRIINLNFRRIVKEKTTRLTGASSAIFG